MLSSTRPKRSLIYTMPLDEFKALISTNNNVADILRFLGFAITGRAHRMIWDRIKTDKIDATHLPKGLANRKGKQGFAPSIPLAGVLVENSTYSTNTLKKRLLKIGLLQNLCSLCGQEPFWNEQPLVMVLDHINGKRDDHRLENLRLLCPNCNSQGSTFSGRNKKYVAVV